MCYFAATLYSPDIVAAYCATFTGWADYPRGAVYLPGLGPWIHPARS